MSTLPILIVGAGPTGLMMACELARYKIPFRIIDKNSGPTQTSNATWLQTRTLEIFDILGMLKPFIKAGRICHDINFYLKGESLATLPLENVPSKYPFILMIPQSEIERLLIAKLSEYNIAVERNTVLTEIIKNENEVQVTLLNSNNSSETLTTHWLIACDGANSTVRNKLNIPFSGTDIVEQFVVADTEMNSFLPDDQVHIFFEKGKIFKDRNTFFSVFPFGNKKYRVTANLYLEKPRKTFNPHEVKEIVAERSFGNYIIDKVSWVSPFWVHTKIVDNLRHGRIFLAGDAGNIHSPAGGQGMNTGIQDAFNLAWKLAFVIKHNLKEKLLSTYQTERLPVLKKITNETEYFTKMFVFGRKFNQELKKFSINLKKKAFLNKILVKLTQLNITYKSPIIFNLSKSKNLLAGKRIQNIQISEAKALYNFLSIDKYNLIIIVNDELSKKQTHEINQLQNTIYNEFRFYLHFIILITKKNDVLENQVLYNQTLNEISNKNENRVILVRPDNYIAYQSTTLNFKKLLKILNIIFER